jgi:hypothetical protein
MIKVGFYVEIDCLLDTRFTLYSQMNPKAAMEAMVDGTYHGRLNDKFKGIDINEFTERYEKRDDILLSRSVLSNAVPLIRKLSINLVQESMHEGMAKFHHFTVNTFPYRLTDEELKGITEALSVWVPAPATFDVVYIDRKDLTPKHCKENYGIMMIYDHWKWMLDHVEEFKTVRCKQVTLMAPAIFFNNEVDEEEVKKQIVTSIHPLKAYQVHMAPLIRIDFIDAKFFSIYGNLDNKEATA